MKNAITAIVVLILTGSLAFALPAGWVKPDGYAYTLSLYAQVLGENGEPITAKGSTFAVFDSEGKCRGLKEVATNSRGVTLYQLSVASNELTETGLLLRIFDASKNEELEISETLDFTANAVIPPTQGATSPQVFHVKPAIVLPENWVRPEGYAYTLSLYAQVQNLDGEFITAKGSTLAVFDAEGVCRGMKAVATNSRGVTLYQLSVASNELEETGLILKIADAETGEIHDIAETLDFTANSIIPASGGASHPQVYHVKPPYEVQGSISLAWANGASSYLAFAADSGMEDAYSASKDQLAENDAAYIIGQNADGTTVKLQRSVRKLADETRWRISVTIGAKSSVVLSWEAVQTEGRSLYLLPQEDSCVAISLAVAGSHELKNTGNSAQSYSLAIVCITDGAMAVYELEPGWNLVSFPFVPSATDTASLLALKPMLFTNGGYQRPKAIEANKGYWLFVLNSFTCLLAKQPAAPNSSFTKGWQMIGVSQRWNVLPSGYHAFEWMNDRFSAVNSLEPSKGYWLYVP